MLYEFLIVNKKTEKEGSKNGTIVCVFPKGHAWGKKEKVEPFVIVPFSGEAKDIQELINGDYTYKDGVFSDLNGVEFSKDMAVDSSMSPEMDKKLIIKLAAKVNPNWREVEKDACMFMHPKHLKKEECGFNNARTYWYRKFRKFGVPTAELKKLLAVIKYNNYGEIAEYSKNLPEKTKLDILASDIFTKEDKDWIRLIWGE